MIIGGLQARWGNVLPSNQYTPLMTASSLAQVKDLVNNKHADINAATWQYDWGRYVTALDCFTYRSRPSAEDLAVIDFLKSKGAKSAENLPGLDTFSGAVISSK